MKNFLEGILSAIDLSAGDRILTDEECNKKYLVVTTGHASNAIIAPQVEGYNFIVVNKDFLRNAIIKVDGFTGVTVSPSTAKRVRCNGTDYALYLIRKYDIVSSSATTSISSSPSSSSSSSVSSSPSSSVSSSPSSSPSTSVSSSVSNSPSASVSGSPTTSPSSSISSSPSESISASPSASAS